MMYAQIEALEKQADEVVLLESRAELAESERDALLEVTVTCGSTADSCVSTVGLPVLPILALLLLALQGRLLGCVSFSDGNMLLVNSLVSLASVMQAGRALTPRPSRELPAAERMLGAEGLATLKAAIDDHKCAAGAGAYVVTVWRRVGRRLRAAYTRAPTQHRSIMYSRLVRRHAYTVRSDRLQLRDVRRDWDGLELAAMLLGAGNGAGAGSGGGTSGSDGGAAGAVLSSGIALGILGCLRDAADQQRLNRSVVTQVILGTLSAVSRVPS